MTRAGILSWYRRGTDCYVGVLCAEVKLGEPVGDRRLVDDGSGFDFGGSAEVGRRQLAKGEVPCVRVPATYD